MPSLVITTNVPIPEKKSWVKDFSKYAAEVLSKPEKYISVSINYDEALSFNGNFDPAFLMVITSLGNIDPEKNEKYSRAFFEYFKDKLQIPGDRGYITFYDPGNAYLGHEGTTFAAIFGAK